MLTGCLSFANFSVLWTSMDFLLAAPPYGFSEGDALAAHQAGTLTDKGKAKLTTTLGLLIMQASWRRQRWGRTACWP
nr:MFS transporter [Candidatus Pantoea persica]